jgi:hypothetical protein
VGRSQGPPRPPGRKSVGRPAAATVYRARGRRRARGVVDGRAVLSARPRLDVDHRGTDPRSEGALHRRHRDPQHAASCAR